MILKGPGEGGVSQRERKIPSKVTIFSLSINSMCDLIMATQQLLICIW